MHHGGPQFFAHQAHNGHPGFWLLCLVLLALLFAVAVYGLLRLSGRGPTGTTPAGRPPTGDAALESVRLRYARGEIDRDEFTRVSTDLGGPPLPAG